VTRSWTQVLAVVVVVALVLATAATMMRPNRPARLGEWFDMPELTEEGLPQLLQRIRDFHRTVTRRGEKILEISAKEASYYRDRSAVEILEPKLVFFQNGERVGVIEAAKGWVVIEDAELVSAELEGAVRLELTKFQIKADSMRYDRRDERILARGITKVTSPELELSGKDLNFDLRAHRLTVDSGVEMRLRPSDEPAAQ
jgi:LPS export ABC transporter protein LptC